MAILSLMPCFLADAVRRYGRSCNAKSLKAEVGPWKSSNMLSPPMSITGAGISPKRDSEYAAELYALSSSPVKSVRKRPIIYAARSG